MSKYRIEEYVDEHKFYAEKETSQGVWHILGAYDTKDAAMLAIENDTKKEDK